jgi:SAM-dependent methyltransferase
LQPATPDAAETHLSEAVASLAAGDLRASGAAYRQARAAAPQSAEVPHRMGLALARAGRPQEAMVQHFIAERLAPAERRYRRALTEAIAGANLAQGSPAVIESLCRLLAAPDVSPTDVAPPAWSLLDVRPAVRHLWLSVDRGDQPTVEACMLEPAVQQQLNDPLFLLLLARAQVLTLEREAALTAMRRFALRALIEKPRLAFLVSDRPEPLAALALQTTLSAHAWLETPAEEAMLSGLSRRTVQGTAAPAELLAYACYRPWPEQQPWPSNLPDTAILREARRRLVEEPAERRLLAQAMPALTPIGGGASAAVKQQYEANPYPRWLATNLSEARPLAEVLRGLFPALAPDAPAGPLSVLVAGCGTGEQALRTASRFTEAEVLAVDLSRASLAYAQQRAAALGLGQIAFAEADLTALGGLEGRFELIDCMGVLHHLADPAAGWRVLRGLLAPGGFMRIGLYSRLGRGPLRSVRRLVGPPRRGQPIDAAFLRRARHRLLENRSQPEAAFALSFFDAWDLDGLRDLLFHVEEHDFTLGEIATLLGELELEFLGFEIVDRPTLDAFRQQYPASGAEHDLALWQAFEEARPGTFAAMYRFWCRAL